MTAGAVPAGTVPAMRVARIGLAAVKGTRHRTLPQVRLAEHGPVGDRCFAVVDPARAQVLRTVAHPSLLAVQARWDGETLEVDLGDGPVAGRPRATGPSLVLDYWGRPVRAQVVPGPWAAAFSDHLGRHVVLVATAPTQVVYGGSVSLVTTGSLGALAPRSRTAAGDDREDSAPGASGVDGVDGARFRATVVVDTSGTGHDRPGAELDWVGREIAVGSALVRVTAATVRCAVVDLDPRTGRPDVRLLAALPRDGRGAPVFGVEGDVVRPGAVETGAAVTVGPHQLSA